MSEAFVAELARQGVGFGQSTVAQAAMQYAPVQVADLRSRRRCRRSSCAPATGLSW